MKLTPEQLIQALGTIQGDRADAITLFVEKRFCSIHFTNSLRDLCVLGVSVVNASATKTHCGDAETAEKTREGKIPNQSQYGDCLDFNLRAIF